MREPIRLPACQDINVTAGIHLHAAVYCVHVCLPCQLASIRCCGHGESLLLIEVDRSSMIDEGELWLQADDSLIVRSMHDTLVRYLQFSPVSSIVLIREVSERPAWS